MVEVVVGIIVSIICLIVGYYLNRPTSRISYQLSSLQIIGNLSIKLPSDFEVMLAGKKINSLYKSQVAIWNSGKTLIEGKNIVKDDPLKIVFAEKIELFNVSILAESRSVNKFRIIEKRENYIKFTFDFWDPKDGVLLEILHTKSPSTPNLIGTVKGLVNNIKYKGQIDYVESSKNNLLINIIFRLVLPIIFSMLLGLVIILLYSIIYDSMTELSYFESYLAVVAGLLIPMIIWANINILWKRKFPRSIRQKNNN